MEITGEREGPVDETGAGADGGCGRLASRHQDTGHGRRVNGRGIIPRGRLSEGMISMDASENAGWVVVTRPSMSPILMSRRPSVSAISRGRATRAKEGTLAPSPIEDNRLNLAVHRRCASHLSTRFREASKPEDACTRWSSSRRARAVADRRRCGGWSPQRATKVWLVSPVTGMFATPHRSACPEGAGGSP